MRGSRSARSKAPLRARCVHTDRGRRHRSPDRRRPRLAPRPRPGTQRAAAGGAHLPRAGGPSARGRGGPRRVDRPLGGPLRLRLVGARRRRAARRRRLLRAAPPRQGADGGDGRPAGRRRPCATRATGSRTRCGPRPRTASSSPATRPGTASRSPARGSGPRSTSGSRAGASCARCWPATKPREQALDDYGAFSAAHAPAFRLALRLQRLIPALPPRVLTAALAVVGRERPCRRAFGWYLEQAHPRFAQDRPGPRAARSPALPPNLDRRSMDAIAFDERGLVPCVIQDWSTGEVLTLAYMNAEALERTRSTRRAAPLEPLARRALAQGRDLGQHPGRACPALRLRRRRGAGAGRAGRPRVPHRRAHLLPPRRAASLPRRTRCCPALERTIAARAAERPEGSYTATLLADPPADRGEGARGGRGGRARRARGERRAGGRGGRRRALPPRRPPALARAGPRRRRQGARWPSPLMIAPARDSRTCDAPIAPTLEETRPLAAEHNLVPVTHTFIADCETPVSAFLKLRGAGPAFLLESAEQGQRVGRWSFIGYARAASCAGGWPTAATRTRSPPRRSRASARRRCPGCRRSRAARWASSATTACAPSSASRSPTPIRSGCRTWR